MTSTQLRTRVLNDATKVARITAAEAAQAAAEATQIAAEAARGFYYAVIDAAAGAPISSVLVEAGNMVEAADKADKVTKAAATTAARATSN